METLLAPLRQTIIRHCTGYRWETPVPRLGVGQLPKPGEHVTSMYRPMACLVLQGAKQVVIGNRALSYNAGSCFIASVDIAVTGCVTEASPERPYLVTSLLLDPQILADLLADLPALPNLTPNTQPLTAGFGVAPAPAPLLDAWRHYLALLDSPADIPALAAARERELLYRLLQTGHGPLLRQMAHADSRLSRVRRAVEHIRAQFDHPIRTETLASLAGMSLPSFHRHFKAATGLSPLQYQKTLRLQAARRLLNLSPDAAKAAFAVGYESPSQFSREYTRHFGAPPTRDTTRLSEAAI